MRDAKTKQLISLSKTTKQLCYKKETLICEYQRYCDRNGGSNVTISYNGGNPISSWCANVKRRHKSQFYKKQMSHKDTATTKLHYL